MENKLKELGIYCPECQAFIHTPLEQFLFGDKFTCKSCSLKFSLNNKDAEQILKQLQAANFTF